MTDQTAILETPVITTTATVLESPAPTASTAEHMIPKSRLDEVLAKAEKAEKALLKFQEAEDKRKKEEMSELERLKLEKKEAEEKAERAANELQTEREKTAILAEANKPQFGDKKQKFVNPEIAYKLLPADERGNALKALQELAKENPYLLEAVAQSGGDGLGSPKKGQKTNLDASATVRTPRPNY